MRSIAVFTDPSNANRWRAPYEKVEFERRFGPTVDWGVTQHPTAQKFPGWLPDDLSVVYWKLHAERTDAQTLATAQELAVWFAEEGVPQINDPTKFPAVHAKDVAWKIWGPGEVPIPQWEYKTDVHPIRLSYPLLLRFNDSVSGEHSYLCQTPSEGADAFLKLLGPDKRDIERRWGPGIGRSIVVQEFIETEQGGYRFSYRIIVAGNKVVTAYARLCSPPEWIAITGKFTPEMGNDFINHQRHCQRWCRTHEAEIVRAVKMLGLNFQGVDVIFDQDGSPYFLEVQPDFSTGNPRYGDVPPFYNPSYPALVQFLESAKPTIQTACPMYCAWLDKEHLFRTSFNALGNDLEVPLR